jgi:hypothetical protein
VSHGQGYRRLASGFEMALVEDIIYVYAHSVL